ADTDSFNSKAWVGSINVAAVAAQSSEAGIANLAGSGKDVYIDSIRFQATVAGGFLVRGNIDTTVSHVSAVVNKSVDGTSLASRIRQGNNQGGGSLNLASLNVRVGDDYEFIKGAPLFVPAGRSVFIDSSAVVNVQIVGVASGREY